MRCEAYVPISPEPAGGGAATLDEETAAVAARRHQTARKGMWVCIGLFVLIWACIHFDWYFKIYLWLLNAWETFVSAFTKR